MKPQFQLFQQLELGLSPDSKDNAVTASEEIGKWLSVKAVKEEKSETDHLLNFHQFP